MPKVMVIEDDANMFSLLHMLLEFEGYEVILWEGGEKIEDIIETLCQEKPDLILMDVHLRHLNGSDIMESFRGEPDLSGTKVLIASGVELTIKSHQAGADGFILKPFMPDELIGKIQQTLE
jgi:DNA-binding response OmpR family regulator